MVKIYKAKNGKLVLYVPTEVVSDLKIKENDEVDFFKVNDRSFVMAKKSDIAGIVMGTQKPAEQQVPRQTAPFMHMQHTPSPEELSVLKKIDTIRYENRTQENTLKILSEAEKAILQGLVANGSVTLFKGKSGKMLYSIPKNIYDNFLMRKKPAQTGAAKASSYAFVQQASQYKAPEDENVTTLEKDGFLVLQTEAEASKVSLMLEQSIRHGQVLGTRSFSKNREFYILLRTYFDRHAQGILRKLRERAYRVGDLAKELDMNEDGARAVLYILAENGDVMEKKRETFTIA